MTPKRRILTPRKAKPVHDYRQSTVPEVLPEGPNAQQNRENLAALEAHHHIFRIMQKARKA